jgi:iron(III) transport system ATP-binding protein
MNVSLRNVTKRFDGQPVLDHVSIEIQAHELFFLLGPSGCGKTTLLRLLAGFYQPDEGEILFGASRMNEAPPHRRNAGMVFQNYALWPHMTVEANVAYGLDVRGIEGKDRERRVAEALAIVRMDAYANRSPNQLSGGQQQRVALARALVIRPDVLLLDEPLSNLDARLRLEMREEIRRIHDETRITTIYVTHDQKESLSLADRMAVLRDGTVEQIGAPRSLYRAPGNKFVADFLGETNWLSGRVLRSSAEAVEVETGFGLFQAPGRDGLSKGQSVSIGFRPEAVRLSEAAAEATLGPPPGMNRLLTKVQRVIYLGEIEQYELEIAPGFVIKAFEQNPFNARRVGMSLSACVRAEDVFVL